MTCIVAVVVIFEWAAAVCYSMPSSPKHHMYVHNCGYIYALYSHLLTLKESFKFLFVLTNALASCPSFGIIIPNS